MSDRTRRPAPGDTSGAGHAPGVSRLWPETGGRYDLGDVLDGTPTDDRRDARDLAADVRHHLMSLFGHP